MTLQTEVNVTIERNPALLRQESPQSRNDISRIRPKSNGLQKCDLPCRNISSFPRSERRTTAEPSLIICLSRRCRTLSFVLSVHYAKPTPLSTLLAHRDRPSNSPLRQFTHICPDLASFYHFSVCKCSLGLANLACLRLHEGRYWSSACQLR